jgi:hypothetical protein
MNLAAWQTEIQLCQTGGFSIACATTDTAAAIAVQAAQGNCLRIRGINFSI